MPTRSVLHHTNKKMKLDKQAYNRQERRVRKKLHCINGRVKLIQSREIAVGKVMKEAMEA